MFLYNIKKILNPAGVILGALIVIVGYVTQAKDMVAWGLPVWAWQAIGAGIFFISIIAILYKHQKDIQRLNFSNKATPIIKQTSPEKVTNAISSKSLDIANNENSKLKKEIERLNDISRPLWIIRNQQLQSLKQTNSMLILSRLESIQFHGLRNIEPFLIIQAIFINCSIFELQLENIKFVADLNGNSLSLAPSLMSEITKMYHSDKILLQFKQPVTSATADLIKHSIDNRDKITWKFQVKGNCIIEATKDVCPPFTHELERKEIPVIE